MLIKRIISDNPTNLLLDYIIQGQAKSNYSDRSVNHLLLIMEIGILLLV